MKISKRKRREREKEIQIQRQRKVESNKRMCWSKRAFDTWDDAEGYAKLYVDPRYRREGLIAEKLRSYLCPLCGKFHLSKREDYFKERITA